MTKTWIVMCRVSGGVTGTRQAPLKTGFIADDGQRLSEVATFETFEAAEKRAAVCRQRMNRPGGPRFEYWPEEQSR